LDRHLKSDQIDELLQSATGNKPGQTIHRYLEDARRHLKNCEGCQTRMRAHEEAMERLALLKPTTPGAKRPICPPDDVWLEIAAGIARHDSEQHLSHVAQCDYCGPLLRQAIEDFADELTPDEEFVIAGLSSSTTGWQKGLAAKLHSSQSLMQSGSLPRHREPSLLANLLAPSRIALAGVLIGSILLGVRVYRRTVYLSAQNLEATAEIHRLEQSVSQQSAHIAELTAQLRRAGTPATAAAPQPTGNVQTASLVLDPGLTRGIASLKRLTIPHGTEIAKITLRLAETPDGLVREDLVTADGQKKWSQELGPPESEKKTNSLSLLVPTYLLTPNDYQIVLSRQSPDGFERFATYTFRVTR
jgi:hypothetical protein